MRGEGGFRPCTICGGMFLVTKRREAKGNTCAKRCYRKLRDHRKALQSLRAIEESVQK